MTDQAETSTSVTKQVASKASKSFPIFSILTLIFVVGKILGKLTWPWFWVLAPLWGPYAFVLVLSLLICAFALGCTIVSVVVASLDTRGRKL